jgi:hypothetical protein
MATGKCFRCWEFGHIACNCPQNHGSDNGDDSGPEVITIAVNRIGIGDDEPVINEAEGALFQPSITNSGASLLMGEVIPTNPYRQRLPTRTKNN